MKKIFLITFWSILLFAGNANAQKYTLSGYIEDSETGEKLISANIFDFRSNSGTVTNTYGFYSLSLDADSLYIDVSYIGYETKTYAILLNKDINLNIELSSSVTLDEIEISADRGRKGGRPSKKGKPSGGFRDKKRGGSDKKRGGSETRGKFQGKSRRPQERPKATGTGGKRRRRM